MNARLPVVIALMPLAAGPLAAAPPAAPPDPEALARQAAELPHHGGLKLDLALTLARAGRTRSAARRTSAPTRICCWSGAAKSSSASAASTFEPSLR